VSDILIAFSIWAIVGLLRLALLLYRAEDTREPWIVVVCLPLFASLGPFAWASTNWKDEED